MSCFLSRCNRVIVLNVSSRCVRCSRCDTALEFRSRVFAHKSGNNMRYYCLACAEQVNLV